MQKKGKESRRTLQCLIPLLRSPQCHRTKGRAPLTNQVIGNLSLWGVASNQSQQGGWFTEGSPVLVIIFDKLI